MSSYIKFLKDILAKKRKINDFEIVALTQATNDDFKNGVPEKMTDPRSFTVSYSKGGMDLGCALCDLGPEGKIEDVLVKVDKFLFSEDFVILDYKADRKVPIILGRPFLSTSCTLIGVHQGELTMHLQSLRKVPIILGRPFLSTSCTLIGVHQGELTMHFNDEEIKFNVVKPMKFPSDVENYSAIKSFGWDYCEE
ncbi:uncharacterized protein LOC127144152 [Cucumis melo]|uniref:Uncharacterized protein LOC127144152 n=1 Tax=Cucumis melo TaxID=3656 RepID=A0ABM3KD06_CUCME|nr:uncharacterized protein LOC127144152 [Cucumis melo]